MSDPNANKGCFTCDKDIVGIGYKMVSAVTSYTKTPLLQKLRNLIGDEFIVVVSQHDRVCINCFSLFDKMDKLEIELRHVQSVLSAHLINKYSAFSEKIADNDDENIPVRKKRRFAKKSELLKDLDDNEKILTLHQENQKATAVNNRLQKFKFCCICNIEVANMRDLESHIIQRHIVEEEICSNEQSSRSAHSVFKCQICSKTFLNKIICRNHVLNFHLTALTASNNFNADLSEQNSNSTRISIRQQNDSLFNNYDGSEHTFPANNHEIVINKYNATTNVEINVINATSDTSDLGKSSCHESVNCLECKVLIDNLCRSDVNSVRDRNSFIICKTCGRRIEKNSIQSNKFLTDINKTEKSIFDASKSDEQKMTGDNLRNTNVSYNKVTGLPSPLKEEINCIAENLAVDSINSLKKNIQEFINLLDSNVPNDEILVQRKTESNVSDIKEAKTYTCTLCNVYFESQSSLNQHYQASHLNNTKDLVFVPNNDIFKDRNLSNMHSAACPPSQNSDTYCQMCNVNCCDKEDLINHIKSIHIKDKFCTICGKQFKKEAIFFKHIEYEHRDNLLCRVCKMQFNHVKELIVHEKGHIKKEFVCDICCKILKTRSSLKAHQITMHTRNYPYICEMCGKGFISTHSLNEHKGKHSSGSRYICDICGKGYRLYDTYHKHRNHHDNPYPKQCTTCKERFRSSSRLAEHIRRKHTFERPYKCPYCPLSFHISSLLKHHVFKHTRQYPYMCVPCKKGYPSRIKYAVHMAKKHKDDTLIKNRHPNNKERQEEWLKCSRKNQSNDT